VSNHDDIYFSWSADGMSFRPAVLVRPGTDDSNDLSPGLLALEPGTGVPHIMYEHVVPGSTPLDGRIMHARLSRP
jgi:hypothetical protein